MIYELRVYEAATGKMDELHSRFRDHTLNLFKRHGIKVVGFFTTDIGDYNDKLIYLLEFNDLAHREAAWKSFDADAEWQEVARKSNENGPILVRIKNQILKPTDYSPLGQV